MRYDSVRRRVTAICNAHHLTRVELTITPGSGQGGYIARAMPATYHPIVEARWRRAGEEYHGSVDLKDLEKISDSVMRQIASATGNSIEGVLKTLHEVLEKQKE